MIQERVHGYPGPRELDHFYAVRSRIVLDYRDHRHAAGEAGHRADTSTEPPATTQPPASCHCLHVADVPLRFHSRILFGAPAVLPFDPTSSMFQVYPWYHGPGKVSTPFGIAPAEEAAFVLVARHQCSHYVRTTDLESSRLLTASYLH